VKSVSNAADAVNPTIHVASSSRIKQAHIKPELEGINCFSADSTRTDSVIVNPSLAMTDDGRLGTSRGVSGRLGASRGVSGVLRPRGRSSLRIRRRWLVGR
jgi:hypothetical protein